MKEKLPLKEIVFSINNNLKIINNETKFYFLFYTMHQFQNSPIESDE